MMKMLKRLGLEKQARAEVKSMTLVPADGFGQHGLTSRLLIGGVKLGVGTLVVMMLGAVPVDGWAFCVRTPAWTYMRDYGLRKDIALGEISVPSDTPIGTTIKIVTVTMPSAGYMATGCPDKTNHNNTNTGRMPFNNDFTIKSIDWGDSGYGIGVRLTTTNSSNGGVFNTNTVAPPTFSGSRYWHGGDVTLELIKIGPITPGALPINTYGRISFSGKDPGAQYTEAIRLADFNVTSGSIISPTCSMTAPANVSLGNVVASTFTGTGTTSGSVSAKLSFSGCDSKLSNVTLKASGTADSDNGNLFKLSSASTAKGIGIELLDKDSKTIKPTGSTDWSTAQKDAQNSGYTFQVRYQQTQSTVTPGTANGTITIDATYK